MDYSHTQNLQSLPQESADLAGNNPFLPEDDLNTANFSSSQPAPVPVPAPASSENTPAFLPTPNTYSQQPPLGEIVNADPASSPAAANTAANTINTPATTPNLADFMPPGTPIQTPVQAPSQNPAEAEANPHPLQSTPDLTPAHTHDAAISAAANAENILNQPQGASDFYNEIRGEHGMSEQYSDKLKKGEAA